MVTAPMKKQKSANDVRSAKPACGTLAYLAECRGTVKKADLPAARPRPCCDSERVKRNSHD